ncbi:MAG: serine/threonine-protein phosphatase [Chloroflexi bacterium]|nr:serine/threonine-protein phosphatase [Chloroflexota bacterium]
MNEPTDLTEPKDLNQETLADSNEPLDAELSNAIESDDGMGIIEIPSRQTQQGEQASPTASSSIDKKPNWAVAYRCSLGAVRKRNEDSCLVFSSGAGGHFPLLPFGLYIVADGMGGHANGHVASKTAVRVTARYILDEIYLPLLHDAGGASQTPIQEVMINATQAANMAVYASDPELDSGTTLTTALILGRRLHISHVGDSRLYLLVDGRLETVTNDHSLVQRMQDVGQPADDITFSQIRHVLLRAIGQVEDIEVDTYMRLLPKKGKLLICTDGLCGPVSDKNIQEIMARDLSVEEIADALTDAAMDAGGHDNITAIVVDFAF